MCGIFGVYSHERLNVAKKIYYGLFALQHRGQEGAGIATSDGINIHYYKNTGLVTDVFRNETLQNLFGYIGIGHVRYSTTGGTAVENCQPFVVRSSFGNIAIAHNGDVVNSDELRKELEMKAIVRALHRWEGNRTRASEELGISRRTLINKIAEYGLEI
jgi:amidophosphoribosyltransferase